MRRPSVIPKHCGRLADAYDILTACRLRAPFPLTSFAFSFFLFLPFVLCPRLWNRTVDHDDDDEGEHDCPNYPPGQDQQGYYFG